MIKANSLFDERLNSPVRHITAKVELFEGSTLLNTFSQNDRIKSITIDRVGESSKFFGFGVCQKLNLHLIDKDREVPCSTANSIEAYLGVDEEHLKVSPTFYVSEVHRYENTNEMSITAYDALYKAAAIYTSELEIPDNYTIEEFATLCSNKLGCSAIVIPEGITSFSRNYEGGANIEGSETLREMLDAVAEATQTIYFVDAANRLIFKRLDADGAATLSITKEHYITLTSGSNRRLAGICAATELGDNIEATLAVSGTTQFVRDNPFWDLQDDIDAIVEAALDEVGGMTINQFECNWRGNFLVEIGDKIALTTKDDETVYSYLLDDVLTYNGALNQKTRWHYENNDAETATNPSNLGDALKQTYAKVDKINREIEIVASEAAANRESIAALELTTDSIISSVKRVEERVEGSLDGLDEELEEIITNKVEAAITADNLKLTVEKILEDGVDKVYTTTGYSFDADGLKISKSGSEMESVLDEDGLKIYRNDTEVLTVDNTGVNGINMTVRQYLIVGGSRFEAYGYNRTGCFWVGQSYLGGY